MAIRYSGDTEVRVFYDPRKHIYVGDVRDPYLHWKGKVGRSLFISDPKSPEAYDKAALSLLKQAQRWAHHKFKRAQFQAETKLGRIRIRRVFQSPCPVGFVR